MKLVKFPRTRHTPWSRSVGEDDKVHRTMKHFHGMQVVVTEKMDGENTTMYSDHFHARSVDSRNHPSRNIAKGIWGNVRHMIPEGYRLCGENLYAKHSIFYDDLESYFYGFSVWDDRNVAFNWDETLLKFFAMGITPVRELYRGVYDENIIKSLWDEPKRDVMEGYVIRTTDEIPFSQYDKLVAKFVRASHVDTDEHWMTKPIVPNKLINNNQ